MWGGVVSRNYSILSKSIHSIQSLSMSFTLTAHTITLANNYAVSLSTSFSLSVPLLQNQFITASLYISLSLPAHTIILANSNTVSVSLSTSFSLCVPLNAETFLKFDLTLKDFFKGGGEKGKLHQNGVNCISTNFRLSHLFMPGKN